MRRYVLHYEDGEFFRNSEDRQLWGVLVGPRWPTKVIDDFRAQLDLWQLMFARYKVAITDNFNPEDGTVRVGRYSLPEPRKAIEAKLAEYWRKITHADELLVQKLDEEARKPRRLYTWSTRLKYAKARARRAQRIYQNVVVAPAQRYKPE